MYFFKGYCEVAGIQIVEWVQNEKFAWYLLSMVVFDIPMGPETANMVFYELFAIFQNNFNNYY